MGLKPILPKLKPFNAGAFKGNLNTALNDTMKVGKGLFGRTVRTWTHSVVFYVVRATDQVGAVGTDDKIYGFVTRGTRPHIIRPRKARRLAFRGGKYSPKTSVGKISSKAGRMPSGPLVLAKVVHHTGSKARGFEESVVPRLEPILLVNVQKAIQKTMF